MNVDAEFTNECDDSLSLDDILLVKGVYRPIGEDRDDSRLIVIPDEKLNLYVGINGKFEVLSNDYWKDHRFTRCHGVVTITFSN